jgi:cephalosporin hydroxylase
MMEGSIVSPEVVALVGSRISGAKPILVTLDSNHTHEHGLHELRSDSPFVLVAIYCVGFYTVIEDLPRDLIVDRPWWPGNKLKTAGCEFPKMNDYYVIDTYMETKCFIPFYQY